MARAQYDHTGDDERSPRVDRTLRAEADHLLGAGEVLTAYGEANMHLRSTRAPG
jgi:hypothetical protein